MRALWIFVCLALLAGAASGQSTPDEVNADYFWYCAAWQNTHGTALTPDLLYNFVGLASDADGNIVIVFWGGDASQPSFSDLETLSPAAVALVKWQYSTLQALATLQMPAVTAAQIGQLIYPAAGMLVFNTDSGAVEVYTGSTWKTVTAS